MRAHEMIQEAGQLPEYYFAYGMLTDPRQMPEADRMGTAELRNHALRFWHYADVVEQAGSIVKGVLWSLPPGMLATLDVVEGYPSLYGRKMVPVYLDGQRYEAVVYYMTPATHQRITDRRPSDGYIKTVARGYIMAGIPLDQIYDGIAASEDSA